jgi:hypothetical protein
MSEGGGIKSIKGKSSAADAHASRSHRVAHRLCHSAGQKIMGVHFTAHPCNKQAAAASSWLHNCTHPGIIIGLCGSSGAVVGTPVVVSDSSSSGAVVGTPVVVSDGGSSGAVVGTPVVVSDGSSNGMSDNSSSSSSVSSNAGAGREKG